MDPADPSAGLRFAGRLSEKFKLSNGTWVLTGELCAAVPAAALSVGEAVVAGHDRDDVRLLVWTSPDLEAGAADRIRSEFEAYNMLDRGATLRIAAFRILADPPSMAAGELTDKRYVNQRAVLANRRDSALSLYVNGTHPDVVLCK